MIYNLSILSCEWMTGAKPHRKVPRRGNQLFSVNARPHIKIMWGGSLWSCLSLIKPPMWHKQS